MEIAIHNHTYFRIAWTKDKMLERRPREALLS